MTISWMVSQQGTCSSGPELASRPAGQQLVDAEQKLVELANEEGCDNFMDGITTGDLQLRA